MRGVELSKEKNWVKKPDHSVCAVCKLSAYMHWQYDLTQFFQEPLGKHSLTQIG